MFIFPMMYPTLPTDYNLPPTIYNLLNNYVNYGKDEKIKISELAKNGRDLFFDFNYPIADELIKEDFEIMILNHFMMRRIGYETITAFKLALNVKLNEIMPVYNKLFNAFNKWEIFEDGEVTIREQKTKSDSTNKLNNETTSSNISDRRNSETPENQLQDIRDGKYVSNYNYDKDDNSATSISSGESSDNGLLEEKITRTPADKMTNYIEFLKEKQNIYSMIFKELDVLFIKLFKRRNEIWKNI